MFSPLSKTISVSGFNSGASHSPLTNSFLIAAKPASFPVTPKEKLSVFIFATRLFLSATTLNHTTSQLPPLFSTPFLSLLPTLFYHTSRLTLSSTCCSLPAPPPPPPDSSLSAPCFLHQVSSTSVLSPPCVLSLSVSVVCHHVSEGSQLIRPASD